MTNLSFVNKALLIREQCFISDINNSSFRIYSAVAAACKYSIGDKNKNGNVFYKVRERGGIGG